MDFKVEFLRSEQGNPLYLNLGSGNLFLEDIVKIDDDWWQISINEICDMVHFESGSIRIPKNNQIVFGPPASDNVRITPSLIANQNSDTTTTISLQENVQLRLGQDWNLMATRINGQMEGFGFTVDKEVEITFNSLMLGKTKDPILVKKGTIIMLKIVGWNLEHYFDQKTTPILNKNITYTPKHINIRDKKNYNLSFELDEPINFGGNNNIERKLMELILAWTL